MIKTRACFGWRGRSRMKESALHRPDPNLTEDVLPQYSENFTEFVYESETDIPRLAQIQVILKVPADCDCEAFHRSNELRMFCQFRASLGSSTYLPSSFSPDLLVTQAISCQGQGTRASAWLGGLDKNHVPATSPRLSAISAISSTTATSTTPASSATATTPRAAMGLGRRIQLCTEELGKPSCQNVNGLSDDVLWCRNWPMIP